jgi:hypothetical protein
LEDDRINDSNDSHYRALCNEFIVYVADSISPKYIALHGGMVKAVAKTKILYRNSEQMVEIDMVPEALTDRSAKWSISKVSGEIFSFIEDSLLVNFIAPNSHETNFINLKKINTLSNPIYYFANFTDDTTILFLSEVATGNITIKNTEKIVYFISFPKWEITVEEFNRTTTNSGWLISDITKK